MTHIGQAGSKIASMVFAVLAMLLSTGEAFAINAPSNLAASTPVSQVNLTWTDNSSDESNFYIERKTGSGGTYSQIGMTGANATSYNDTSVAYATTYYYRVRGRTLTGTYSTYAAEVSATTTDGIPTNFVVMVSSSTQATLTWTDNTSNESGFYIERKTGSGGTYSQITSTAANIVTYNNTGLTTGTNYYYRMRARGTGTTYSAYSAEVGVTTLQAPTTLAAVTSGSTQVNLTWVDNSPGETGFRIERKTGSGGTYSEITTTAANATSYSDTGLASNNTYYYQVRATSADGNSSYSNVANATPLTVPNAPSGLGATPISTTQINLAWTDNSTNESGFKLERKTGVGGTYAQIYAPAANAVAYNNTGLSAGVTYYYRIRATNAAGDSAYSSEVSGTTMSIPAAPSGLGASAISNSQINLTWTDNSGNETGFKIERKAGAGSYAQITTAAANATGYSDTSVASSTTYTYRIRATNTIGDSAYSNTASATTSAPGSSANTSIRTSAFEYDGPTGLLTKEIVESDNSDVCLVTAYIYDVFGNKTSATVRNCSGVGSESAAPTGDPVFVSRVTSEGYDAVGRFATTATNAMGKTETRGYNPYFGSVTSLLGPNNLTTSWLYDGLGRKTKETRADSTTTDWVYSYCTGVNGGSATCPPYGAYLVQTTVKNSGSTQIAPVTKVYYDTLGREIRSETQGFDGTAIYKDTQYDSQGRVYRVSEPYFSSATPVWTTNAYDTLGRPTQIIAPNGGVTTTTYNGLTTSVTNPLNQTETRIKNSQGQLIQVNKQ